MREVLPRGSSNAREASSVASAHRSASIFQMPISRPLFAAMNTFLAEAISSKTFAEQEPGTVQSNPQCALADCEFLADRLTFHAIEFAQHEGGGKWTGQAIHAPIQRFG